MLRSANLIAPTPTAKATSRKVSSLTSGTSCPAALRSNRLSENSRPPRSMPSSMRSPSSLPPPSRVLIGLPSLPSTEPKLTCDGGGKELGDLIDEGIDLGGRLFELSLLERKASGHDVPEVSDETLRDVALAVGVGAIKFADLSTHRTSDYKFDFATMLATKGNTATYMQYAYARCRAIFRKENVADARFRTTPPAVVISHAAERALALQLLRFPEAVEAAAADYLPHVVTAYLFDLAKAASVFYENCPVLKAETPQLKDSRLLLVDLVGRVIKQALDLLGIRTVERL